jgi:hypothetical protein
MLINTVACKLLLELVQVFITAIKIRGGYCCALVMCDSESFLHQTRTIVMGKFKTKN